MTLFDRPFYQTVVIMSLYLAAFPRYYHLHVFISKINKYHVKVRRTLTDIEA